MPMVSPLAFVVYVDREGGRTEKFTERLNRVVGTAANEGFDVVSVTPNGGLSETLGVWVFFRLRPNIKVVDDT
jgi:hypothetical protein